MAAIAASIAGVTALTISTLIWSVSPKAPAASDLELLKKEMNIIKRNAREQDKELKTVKDKINTPVIESYHL